MLVKVHLEKPLVVPRIWNVKAIRRNLRSFAFERADLAIRWRQSADILQEKKIKGEGKMQRSIGQRSRVEAGAQAGHLMATKPGNAGQAQF